MADEAGSGEIAPEVVETEQPPVELAAQSELVDDDQTTVTETEKESVTETAADDNTEELPQTAEESAPEVPSEDRPAEESTVEITDEPPTEVEDAADGETPIETGETQESNTDNETVQQPASDEKEDTGEKDTEAHDEKLQESENDEKKTDDDDDNNDEVALEKSEDIADIQENVQPNEREDVAELEKVEKEAQAQPGVVDVVESEEDGSDRKGVDEETEKKDDDDIDDDNAEITAEPSYEDGPQPSDTFADGERPESPVAIGERLSREGTPTKEEERSLTPPEIVEPGTPQYGSDDGDEQRLITDVAEEEDEYEEEEFQEFDREMLIEKYHAGISEREQLQQQNFQLQHKLADYFRKKKADDSRQEMDKNVTDQEQRYLKYMSNLEDLRQQDFDQREDFKHQIEDLKDKCQERQEKVDEERDRFMEFKKQIAISAMNTRSGKPIAPKDVEMYLATEAKKEAEVVNVRLENIKLKNKLKKKEMQLKSKEELAEGLHLIDFEQLKIENQTYNEKIEERNEELLKLRKKITSTVQVLTHLKEKLQFVQGENQVLKGYLHDIEGQVGQKRDVLSRTKQARDALRIDNHRLRQNCGLLGNESLLRDFEERKDESSDLQSQLEKLKMTHAELTLSTNGFRRKIEQAKQADMM